MIKITSSIKATIERALSEDIGPGDVTTDALIPAGIRAVGALQIKAPGIIAGLEIALEVFRQTNPEVETRVSITDGSEVNRGDVVAEIDGNIDGILKGERVALNFLQRLSGIATETSRYVKAIQGTKARIIDTRKTVPGLRELEKYAVRMGGGHNHRYNLADGILIKDNHIAALRSQQFSIKDIVHRARQNSTHTLRIQIEVETFEEAIEALEAHADAILLDNMPLEEIQRVVKRVGNNCLLEASGGVNLETVMAIAETGVDLISVGALTHSVRAMDISLEIK